jgi:hypothetical protein
MFIGTDTDRVAKLKEVIRLLKAVLDETNVLLAHAERDLDQAHQDNEPSREAGRN